MNTRIAESPHTPIPEESRKNAIATPARRCPWCQTRGESREESLPKRTIAESYQTLARALSVPLGPPLSRRHQSRGEARELPQASGASRIKLDAVQARLYVVRAGDAWDRKSAGCAVSPVRAPIASLHHLAALSRAADAPYTAAPRFSTRPSVSTGASVTLQNFSRGHDPANSDPCHASGSSVIPRNPAHRLRFRLPISLVRARAFRGFRRFSEFQIPVKREDNSEILRGGGKKEKRTITTDRVLYLDRKNVRAARQRRDEFSRMEAARRKKAISSWLDGRENRLVPTCSIHC